MRVLAINCGSSSLKCSLIDTGGGARLFDARIENVGGAHATIAIDGGEPVPCAAPDQAAAVGKVFDELQRRADLAQPEAVAHRIVHGGESFRVPVRVTDEVLERIAALDELAPLHNPPAVAALRAARARLALPQVAVFDTSFHATLPPRARDYALPGELRQRFGIRRFGFHGISHAHVMRATAQFLRRPPQELRIVSCHLGSGASVAAIEYGRSVETSMGMTPLEGLVMGTRAGDLDPGVLLHLLRDGGFDAPRLDELLNRHSGLKGLTGTNDVRDIEQRAAGGEEASRAALTLFAHRARKYIGAYAAVMGGVDAIVFTGGIGEHSALLRNRILQRLDFLGARLDDDLNADARVDAAHPVARISSEGGVALLVVSADEEAEMAGAAAALLAKAPAAADRRVPIAVSARHAHLTQATLEKLFGAGYTLQPRAPLSQHGQFAARECVALIGPRGRIDNVRVLGPPRAADQVEISRTDEFVLGIDAPVRISGDLANTPGITLEGPRGRVRIEHGVVCARRHIHMNPDDARRLGLADHASVRVRVDGDGRDLVFEDVVVRIRPDFQLELHLDTDEANAAGVTPGITGELLA
ncbi:MAG TPA: acetate/propionate family kinase [Steroidobacteraceae bacterium]|nr:acetate/propionate family kinase [Steroidobacteraceae bacterium]